MANIDTKNKQVFEVEQDEDGFVEMQKSVTEGSPVMKDGADDLDGDVVEDFGEEYGEEGYESDGIKFAEQEAVDAINKKLEE